MEIEVRGPGHHERSEVASKLAAVLARSGRRVWIRLDIRPRLAADISQILAQGAERVVIEGEGMVGWASKPPLEIEIPLEVVEVVMHATADPLGVYGATGTLSDAEIDSLRDAGIRVVELEG